MLHCRDIYKKIVKAAPVLWDKKVVSSSEFGQAVVINAE